MEKEKNNNRYNLYLYVMEYAWLAISLSSLFTAGTEFYYHGWDNECLKFIILFILSGAMYIYRRYKRKHQNKN